MYRKRSGIFRCCSPSYRDPREQEKYKHTPFSAMIRRYVSSSLSPLSVILLVALFVWMGTSAFSIGRYPSEQSFLSQPQPPLNDSVWRQRRGRVVSAFQHAYSGYKTFAWGADELRPISKQPYNFVGFGSSIVSSLDTMILMGLEEEYQEARQWVRDQMFAHLPPSPPPSPSPPPGSSSNSPDSSTDNTTTNHTFIVPKISVFECSIRIIGGLLGAYTLTNDTLYVDRAQRIADWLLPAFDTPSGIPHMEIFPHNGQADSLDIFTSVGQAGTYGVEWRYLSEVTGNPIYRQVVDRAMRKLLEHPFSDTGPLRGLSPTYRWLESGEPVRQDPITVLGIGGENDSYYEYLLKMYLVEGGWDDSLLQVFEAAIESMRYAADRTHHQKYWFVGDVQTDGQHIRRFDHLGCFLGAVLELYRVHTQTSNRTGDEPRPVSVTSSSRHPGVPNSKQGTRQRENENTEKQQEDAEGDSYSYSYRWREMARGIGRSCYHMYADSPMGLAADQITYFTSAAQAKDVVSPDQQHRYGDDMMPGGHVGYELRPEVVESLYYLYYYSGEEVYREWAWTMFEAMERYARVDSGYSSICDVRNPANITYCDRMHSFLFSETLKYYYLLFSDRFDETVRVNPESYIFTTEAHPIPFYTPKHAHTPLYRPRSTDGDSHDSPADNSFWSGLLFLVLCGSIIYMCFLVSRKCIRLYEEEDAVRRQAMIELDQEVTNQVEEAVMSMDTNTSPSESLSLLIHRALPAQSAD